MVVLNNELYSLMPLELSGEDTYFINSGSYISKDIIVKENSNIELYLTHFSNLDLNFFVQKGATINLKILNLEGEKTLNLKGNLSKSAIFNIFLVDLSKEKININSNIILYDDDSESSFNFSSLVNKNNLKKYNISYSHIGERTISNLKGFGVSMDTSELNVNGISHIEKGANKSNANQSVKVILFDKESKAKASPTLKIDCEDIKASHGCAIGSLNEEHLYYLLSRGLSEIEARKLITYGYLLPISLNYDEEIRKIIEETIYRSL